VFWIVKHMHGDLVHLTIYLVVGSLYCWLYIK